MLLADAYKLAVRLLDEHRHRATDNLAGWRVEFDNARRRLGCCRHRTRTISLSRAYVGLNDEARVRNTILHEIAHAIVGPTPRREAHGYAWKRVALSIGCDGRRCADGDDIVQPPRRYVGECPNGHTLRRDALPRRGRSSCATCAPRFDERFIITWRRNVETTAPRVLAIAAESVNLNATQPNEGDTMKKNAAKNTAAASKKSAKTTKTAAKRAAKADDRVCTTRGCDVRESAAVKANANYSFRKSATTGKPVCVKCYRASRRKASANANA